MGLDTELAKLVILKCPNCGSVRQQKGLYYICPKCKTKQSASMFTESLLEEPVDTEKEEKTQYKPFSTYLNRR